MGSPGERRAFATARVVRTASTLSGLASLAHWVVQVSATWAQARRSRERVWARPPRQSKESVSLNREGSRAADDRGLVVVREPRSGPEGTLHLRVAFDGGSMVMLS